MAPLLARKTWSAGAFLALAAAVRGASLDDVCTPEYAAAALPPTGFYDYVGLTVNADSVTANPVTNYTVGPTDSVFFPAATFDYCNVTFTYSHTGRNDSVLLTLWLPTPDEFQNRWLSTGGGGYAINSGTGSLPGGVQYGAVAGQTDGGFGVDQSNAIDTFLVENGTVDWQDVYMFGYQAIRELTLLGRNFTANFFETNDTKVYTYYQGCSEGGREGWSQVQRFSDAFDGAAIGAPAFRFAFQQVQHLYSGVVEKTLDYYPPPCELEAIMNATILACDGLDGRLDGVVARTDLCTANFNINATLGLPYSCAASSGGGGFGGAGGGATTTPAQVGNVTAEAIAVAQTILDGLHDDEGNRVYFSYTPTSSWDDAETTYNADTGEWEATVSGLGGGFVHVLLQLQEGDNLASLDGITYSTLRDWIYQGWNEYQDSLMTNWPDLTPYKGAGGKVIHFHGESDFSIPAASSVRYWNSVREVLFPHLSYNDSVSAINDFYKLYLIPGAGHCDTNAYEPNGPFPQTNLAVLIDWVENGVQPVTLNGTVLQGDNLGANQQICAFPLRPYWANNGTTLQCQYDQASIDSWNYDIDAFALPVY
ncbi:putative tannase [Coniella lustricola]|uniref:Carboxylic ester hydrolase n=1 Tax=Coniella lustricola TaxID=2025994 RepID=A0A2T2ZYB4_9PEZI|nr:putative tannase [Coniella lustricola]